MKEGQAGVVQDWGLAVRKREQQRIDRLVGAKRKRGSAGYTQDSDDEDYDEGGNGGNGYPVPATAVPEWLLALCSKGYSTQAILEIFNRLHTEILQDSLPCFPDIEILPNIVVDSEEPKSPKAYTRRTSVGAGHKRSQSLGVGMKSDYYSLGRRQSQSSVWSQNNDGYDSPTTRKRRHDMSTMDSPDRHVAPYHRSHLSENSRRMQLPHRPVFENIEEHEVVKDSYYSISPQAHHGSLPAPTPQRFNGQSIATHLEANRNMHGPRRTLHQRSHSHMGAFVRPSADISPGPSPNRHEDGNPANPFHGQPHGYHHQRQWESSDSHHHGTQKRAMHQSNQHPMSGHARHQSVPMAPTYSPQPMQGMRNSQQPVTPHPYPPHVHTSLPAIRHFTETSETRELYSSRR